MLIQSFLNLGYVKIDYKKDEFTSAYVIAQASENRGYYRSDITPIKGYVARFSFRISGPSLVHKKTNKLVISTKYRLNHPL